MVRVVFIRPSGETIEVMGNVGESVLNVAHANEIEMEGACEGSMACSTCHVIVDDNWVNKLPSPTDEEQDMLDLTYGLTRKSRLGCQIRLTEGLAGLVLKLPSETHNMLD